MLECRKSMIRKIDFPKIYESDLDKIRIFLNKTFSTFHSVRTQVILALLLKTGIKTSVLAALNVNDYNKHQGILLPKHPNAPKQIKLDNDTKRIINDYLSFRWFLLKRRSIEEVEAFLISDPNAIVVKVPEDLRLSPRTIQRTFKEFAMTHHLSGNFTPKSLRHIVGLYFTRLGLDNTTIDSIIGNVAPWVKTDYRRLNQKRSLVNKKPKETYFTCEIHQERMKKVSHKKFGFIWLCPDKSCLYVLDSFGQPLKQFR